MTDYEEIKRDVRETRDKVNTILEILHGKDDGSLGALQKLNFLWRSHIIWPLCTLSALCGALGTILIQKLIK